MAKYESSSKIIRQIAELSYMNEKIIYQKAGFKKELENLQFNNAQTLRNYLKDKKNFNNFQDALKILVYGENYTFVKYFYDKNFISQIAINTEKWEKKVLSGTSGKAISHDAYQRFQKSIKEAGYLNDGTEREQIKALQKKLRTAGKNLWSFIEKLGIINSAEILNKLGKDQEEILADFLADYLLNASFTYGYNDKTGKKLQKITGEGTIVDIMTKGLKGQSYYREVENGKLKIKYPTATFLELEEIINEKEGTIEFQVFADKNTITRVVTGAVGYLQDWNKLQDNAGNTIVSFTEQSDNSIKMAFNENANLKNLNSDSLTESQCFDAAITILNVIRTILQNHNDIPALQDFDSWRSSKNVDNVFAKLIYDDKHILDEILNKRTMAHVSGTIGEVMFSLFLKILQSSHGVGKGIKILGQTDFGTGSAAVDTKILTGELRDIGFQIKNYTSIKNTISLYSQSNKLSAEKEMQRYIEEWAYKILCEIFFKYNIDEGSIFPNKNYEEKINEVENILEYHIPYYLRFDEASLQKQEQDLTQNNFYILNFSFIPASVIFIIIAEALETEEKKKTKFFFFSKGKKEGELLPQPKNLLASWEQTYKEIDSLNSEDNILNKLKDNLYLNFIGIRITFKKELEILFENCKR